MGWLRRAHREVPRAGRVAELIAKDRKDSDFAATEVGGSNKNLGGLNWRRPIVRGDCDPPKSRRGIHKFEASRHFSGFISDNSHDFGNLLLMRLIVADDQDLALNNRRSQQQECTMGVHIQRVCFFRD
jgi:hypothetical protein